MTTTREEAVALRDAAVAAGHTVRVTPGVFGRAYVDCSCGHTAVRASSHAGNLAGLAHAIEVLR